MQQPDGIRPITTGNVLREALVVFGRRWWRYVALYALIAVPYAFTSFLPWPWLHIAHVVLFVFFVVAFGAIVYAVLYDEDSRSLGPIAYVKVAPRWLVLLVADFLYILVVLLGLLVFIVPGLIFAGMLSVYVPVLVAERNVGIGFRRSAHLTFGRRWTGFWVAALPILLGFALWIADATTHFNDVVELAGWLALDSGISAYGAVAAAVFYRRLVEQA